MDQPDKERLQIPLTLEAYISSGGKQKGAASEFRELFKSMMKLSPTKLSAFNGKLNKRKSPLLAQIDIITLFFLFTVQNDGTTWRLSYRMGSDTFQWLVYFVTTFKKYYLSILRISVPANFKRKINLPSNSIRSLLTHNNYTTKYLKKLKFQFFSKILL